MTLPELYSAENILNTLSTYISTDLLARNYLVGWQERNAVQTPDGWYYGWDANFAAYVADGTFNARWTTAKGLVTMVEGFATEPRFIERPIAVAGPMPQHEVLVPALSLELTPPYAVRFAELGSGVQWWNHTMLVEGYFRTRAELRTFADLTMLWFQEQTPLTILRHDDSSLAVIGDLQFLDAVAETELDLTVSQQLVYHLVCNARLEYAA